MLITPEGKDKLFAIGTFLALMYVMYVVTEPFITKSRRSKMSDKEIFTDIYKTREWGGWNGVGPGSTEKDGAQPFINYLQNFLNSHPEITTVVDMGCGYGELLKNIKWPKQAKYLGLDIVDSVIDFNRKHYVKKNIKFSKVNKLQDLAKYKGDLLILKDVIQHWTTQQILYAKNNIIPNFRYAIIVNNIHTRYLTVVNSEISTGESRPIDLKAKPFFMNPKEIKHYELPPFRTKRIHLFENDPKKPQRPVTKP